jgi:hypothetical protein
MPSTKKAKRYRRFIIYIFGFLLLLFIALPIVAKRLVEPILKKRLHTLIVQGSDSLYTYELGDLDASFFGGNVEVENLQINVDSSKYKQLAAENDLPSLTMQLNMVKGQIKGVAVFALLFRKRITIKEIITQDANIRLLRHLTKVKKVRRETAPLWKSIQPAIKSISIGSINLDGVKLLYRNADTATAIKVQFDTCHGLFNDILIDSAASFDRTRIGFTKEIDLKFSDLKYRTPDSMSKMKAEVISYSSKNKTFEIVNFKVQPTREEKKDFYTYVNKQQAMNVIEFERASFTNFQLDRFLHSNIIAADSLIVQKPQIEIYTDKSYPPLLDSKIGTYPHQRLLGTDAIVMVKGIAINNASLSYTEKGEKSGLEGTLKLKDLNISVSNVTNAPELISKNNKCVLKATGSILEKSPLNASFTFYLDSVNGRFDATGTIKNVTSTQLNELAVPLANVKLQSLNLHQLDFTLYGDDFGARGEVRMRYNDLFVLVRKKDDETGVITTKKLLTKVINKYTLHSSNPAAGGGERKAVDVRRLRVSSQGYFAVIWKAIFSGMQNIMLKQGEFE